MERSDTLSLTPKGEEELKKRTYKLNIKKRNALILTPQPRTLQYVLDHTIFSKEEMLEEITVLVRDGFLVLNGAGSEAAIAAATRPTASTSAKPAAIQQSSSIQIHEDITLSEARFLSVDFCVNAFGTSASHYVEQLSACKTVTEFSTCLTEVGGAIRAKHPKQIEAFYAMLGEVNQTAA